MSKRKYCSICDETITEKEYKWSMERYNKALCRKHQPQKKEKPKNNYKPQKKEPTTYAKKLYDALKRRKSLDRCYIELEKYDGHKHIDITIEFQYKPILNIEIDSKEHLTNSDKLWSDIQRDYWSNKKTGVNTIHIPNDWIKTDCSKIARSIESVVKNIYWEINNAKKTAPYKK